MNILQVLGLLQLLAVPAFTVSFFYVNNINSIVLLQIHINSTL